ncbi:LxmA leader domain family RiPP [Nocardia wallacei]|uniref:LxmA leader domain family RiPP n=1 Tax=Nocardia wallacei TaxID=480035 RepID=UPI002455771F|nr:LxmA leader domain family RiPP [Nocardia wallacei]
MTLSKGYRMYTTDDELASSNVSGVAAPAATPVLTAVLLRATLIAQKSSQQCAISLAGGTPNVKKTIQTVC